MRKLFEQAVSDLRNGDNIDVYLTIVVSFILVVAGIIGVVNFVTLAAGILATLSLLAIGTLSVRRSAQEMREILTKFKPNVEKFEWASQIATNHDLVRNAETIDWIAASNHKTLAILESAIADCLRNGCRIRLLIIDPDSDVPKILTELGHSKMIPTYVESALEKCKIWFNTIPNCKLEVRYLIGQPPYRLMIVDGFRPTGYVRVRLTTFPGSKDTFTFKMTAFEDAEWFGFFTDQFEKFWLRSKPVSLEEEIYVGVNQ